MLKAKAPSSKPQAPGKLQIPSSNVAVNRRRSSVWAQPDRWPAYLTRRIWNLELGASLEVGLWLLELSCRTDPLKTAENLFKRHSEPAPALHPGICSSRLTGITLSSALVKR